MVDLVSGGSVINGATPYSFHIFIDHMYIFDLIATWNWGQGVSKKTVFKKLSHIIFLLSSTANLKIQQEQRSQTNFIHFFEKEETNLT